MNLEGPLLGRVAEGPRRTHLRRPCNHCGLMFEPTRPRQKHRNPSCRVAAFIEDRSACVAMTARERAPASVNPLTDEVGTNCMVGQRGSIWFLSGFFGIGSATRTCSVPEGVAVFPRHKLRRRERASMRRRDPDGGGVTGRKPARHQRHSFLVGGDRWP